MAILIEDMEMPKDGCHHIICIYADGMVSTGGRKYMAVSVPPHGKLIDADTLDVIGYSGIPQGHENTFDDGVMWLAEQIDLLPTIIPAEEAER